MEVLNRQATDRPGPFLLAANHISHFDPPVIALASRREIDWMAMVELFGHPLVRAFCEATGAFPTDRSRVDRTAVRTAMNRLRAGRCVGIFPEGGIRTGAASLLHGAPVKPGVATLAVMAGAPVIPCVILGSDRLYQRRWWLPWNRATIWIAFGNPIDGQLQEGESREEGRLRIEQALSAEMVRLYETLQARYCLGPDDLPHTADARAARMF